MEKFKITVKEIRSFQVEIEAENFDDASEKAEFNISEIVKGNEESKFEYYEATQVEKITM